MIEDQAELSRIGNSRHLLTLSRVSESELEIDREDGGGHFRVESFILKGGAKRTVNLGTGVAESFEIREGGLSKSAKACDVRYSARVFAFAVRALVAAAEKVAVEKLDDAAVIRRLLKGGAAG